jgi:hypothetical protein
MLFTEDERRERRYAASELIVMYDCGDDPTAFVDEEFGGRWPTAIKYVASLAVVKDRLEFMGITLAAVREFFEAGIGERLDDLQRQRQDPWTNSELFQEMYDREEAVLQDLTLDRWLEAFAHVIREKLQPNRAHWYGDGEEELGPELPSVVRFLLGLSWGEGVWFPGHDFRMFMRAAVEITGTRAEVVYDISELFEGEDLDEADLCSWARREMAEEFVINHKVVVLAEGRTDVRAIEGALRILYPHLADYYSFMDFEGTRAPGGAAALVATIKAFVGAGIVNRIVAFFDNDTAARAALRSLRDIELPESVRVLHYPPAPWAEQYPTLGPQGLVAMDINGLAGSLELYFGLDVLRQQDGKLVPVQWRGYDESLNQYQGELMHKTELQERFASKLRDCMENPGNVSGYDWTGMRTIVDQLRSAFH